MFKINLYMSISQVFVTNSVWSICLIDKFAVHGCMLT